MRWPAWKAGPTLPEPLLLPSPRSLMRPPGHLTLMPIFPTNTGGTGHSPQHASSLWTNGGVRASPWWQVPASGSRQRLLVAVAPTAPSPSDCPRTAQAPARGLAAWSVLEFGSSQVQQVTPRYRASPLLSDVLQRGHRGRRSRMRTGTEAGVRRSQANGATRSWRKREGPSPEPGPGAQP